MSTFYSKYGDYIGRLASFLAIVYILQLIITYLRHKDLINKNKMMTQHKYLIFTLFSLILFGACDKV